MARVRHEVSAEPIVVRFADFAARRALPTPYVGLCTSASTQHAEMVVEEADALRVLTLVSVGLGNPIAAGMSSARVAHAASTINTIVAVAATGRGRPCEYGGSISVLGALVARATRRALAQGVRAWLTRHQ